MHAKTSFETLQKIFFGLGAVGLVISCLMTFKFGYSMSILHAVALVTVTIAAAFIFPMKAFIETMGFKNAGRWVAVIGTFFIGLEFFSHLGYTIGMREASNVSATVQTAAYEARQKSVKTEEANLEMFRKQLAELEAQNAWVTTVSADGLRAQITAYQKDIDLEEARGGCKSKCLQKMKAKADLEERIALAEKAQDLTKRIEATQRVLDGKTDVAVQTDTGFSPVKAQTDFVGKGWLLITGKPADEALNPDAVTLTVTQFVIGFLLALGATMLPTTAFFLAFFGHKPKAPEAGAYASQSLDVARTEAPAKRRLSIREAMESGLLALPRAA